MYAPNPMVTHERGMKEKLDRSEVSHLHTRSSDPSQTKVLHKTLSVLVNMLLWWQKQKNAFIKNHNSMFPICFWASWATVVTSVNILRLSAKSCPLPLSLNVKNVYIRKCSRAGLLPFGLYFSFCWFKVALIRKWTQAASRGHMFFFLRFACCFSVPMPRLCEWEKSERDLIFFLYLFCFFFCLSWAGQNTKGAHFIKFILI